MLDGMDVMLFAFALTSIQKEFGLTSAAAGSLASLTLLISAAGGALAGRLADRYGRTRVLIFSILVYSVFTGMTATARSFAQLALWRALVGLGLGAEWSAGSVLVSESWPPAHRGKAAGIMQSGWALGYLAAALLAALILPRWGWRPLFLAGTLPALLTFWIRRAVPEPEVWRRAAGSRPATGRAVLRNMALATLVATFAQSAYWGLFTWLPAYLASPTARGGAGLGIVRTSAWIVPVEIGAFLGYTSFGFLGDRFGRRPVFALYVFGAAALVPVYGFAARSPLMLLLIGPLLGFLGHGCFSVFGALLAELFPSGIRATAQGICYNGGRAASALAPWIIGAAAQAHGTGPALTITSAFFAAAGLLVFTLPETSGKELS